MFLIQGQPMSASLSISACTSFTNAAELKARGHRRTNYLPARWKAIREARLWNSVFNFAQDTLGIPRGTIRATGADRDLARAFEMDEILFELKDHSPA